MKAPKLIKTKKANSRSQSQLQVGKYNFSEIPTGVTLSTVRIIYHCECMWLVSILVHIHGHLPT